MMHSLARVLTASHREGFRRILRSMITPGTLDVTAWSATALRVLKAVCVELGINVTTSIRSLALSFKQEELSDHRHTSSVHIRPKEKKK